MLKRKAVDDPQPGSCAMPLAKRHERSKASEEPIGDGAAAPAPNHTTDGVGAGLLLAAAPATASIHLCADGTAAHHSNAGLSAAASADHLGASAVAAAPPAVGGRAFRAFHASAEISMITVSPAQSRPLMLKSTTAHQYAVVAAEEPQMGSPDAANSLGRTRAQSADARAHLGRIREVAGQHPAAQAGQQGSPEAAHASLGGKAAAEAGGSKGAEQAPPKGPGMQTRSRGILRKLKLRPDGTQDEGAPQQQQQPASPRSPAAHARSTPPSRSPLPPKCEPSSPRAVTRSSQRRVQFARGPLDGPPDGHPAHEGQTARQRRSLEAGYPQDLTPASVRMLETELGEPYRSSINRLKRRVGLLPRINRPRRHVTHTKPAPVQAPPPPAPRLRVLRPRSPLFECDSETESDLDSPTSSGALRDMFGSPLRSTASNAPESPKAPWSANTGGVRHGAARSVSAGRRKNHVPMRARPQSPRGAPIFYSRPGEAGQPHRAAAAAQASPRKRPLAPPSSLASEQDAPDEDAGAALGGQPRSPRRQRPPPGALRLGSPLPCAAPLPPPQAASSQHPFLLRSGSLSKSGTPPLPGGLYGISTQPQSPRRGLSCAWRPTSPGSSHAAAAAAGVSPFSWEPNEAAQQPHCSIGALSREQDLAGAAAKQQPPPLWLHRLRSFDGLSNGMERQPSLGPAGAIGGLPSLGHTGSGKGQLGSLHDSFMSSSRLLRSNSQP